MAKKTLATGAAVLLAVLLWAPAARGQVESHWLPPAWPTKLFPRDLTELPDRYCQDLSVPLDEAEEAPQNDQSVEATGPRSQSAQPPPDEAQKETGDGGGRRDATSLADMLKEPRAVIEQARAGQHKEAAKAGRKLLEQDAKVYTDFTWDYLGTAAAWSYLQLGRLDRAGDAHRAATQRVEDRDLRQYHSRAARMIDEVAKGGGEGDDRPKPEDLKDFAKFRALLDKEYLIETKRVERNLELAAKAKTVIARLNSMGEAYEDMRLIRAADPQAVEPLVKSFREVADPLITDLAAKYIEQGLKIQQTLVESEDDRIPSNRLYLWNNKVLGLWACVQETKRLCRVHDYLRRLDLAGADGAARMFDQVHNLLFVPGSRNYVFKTMGKDPRGTFDLTRRGPTSIQQRGEPQRQGRR